MSLCVYKSTTTGYRYRVIVHKYSSSLYATIELDTYMHSNAKELRNVFTKYISNFFFSISYSCELFSNKIKLRVKRL